ncbi:hypothetical protein [Novipirellula maiorica]|nr:hypothetical protein [Rhodopirellula maiorica]
MDQNDDLATVVVIDASQSRLATHCDADTALTLIALASEDPANWNEAMSAWPRYRTPAVCEFASSVPLEETDCEEAMEALQSAEAWLVIDFREKRILMGGNFMSVDRDDAFAMVVDETGKQHCPLSIHLPPWWELHKGVTAETVNQPRQSPINKPYVNRDILYGDAFLTDIAARVLETVDSDAWRNSNASEDRHARYPFTVAVHRDWLLTPRSDLGGRVPRQLLHGAIEWNDHVTWGQRRRFEDGGPMIAAPDNWAGFESAPMGSQEMCLYFDLCREVIDASWFFLTDQRNPSDEPTGNPAPDGSNSGTDIDQLTELLRGVKDLWLSNSFEGGSSPNFIIECDRRRVPRGAEVVIDGIDEVESEQHIADCDCPICEMMADGLFGVGFTSIDGHHLELDNEFAFSMIQTRDAWEQQQIEDAKFHAEMDRKWAEREASGETHDPFASAWSGVSNEGPIPGDSGGFLKMAFMVAEIVSELERCNASRDDITSLNECFANYRRSDADQRLQSASELKANLQSLADRYSDLVSKSADLQSRIDEALRRPASNETDLDHPF